MGTRALKATWLIPPGQPAWAKRALKLLQSRVPDDPELVWALSSGTQSVGQIKCIGLKRRALRASARAVNRHLSVTAKDRWLVTLPEYHVGGYMIRVRAELSGSPVYRLKRWDAQAFVDACLKHKICLVSLVPTQIFDLVTAQFKAPASVRAIVVGGGALDVGLYAQARVLGWPVLPSYGLTETGSQVATAPLVSLKKLTYPNLEVLPHAQIQIRRGKIWIRAKSLCRWIAVSDGTTLTLEDPRREGWLPTTDLGRLTKSGLRVLGRSDDIVKVLGVLVSIPQIESDLRPYVGACAVLGLPDTRAGVRLIACTDDSRSLPELERQLALYNQNVRRPNRIAELCWVGKLPRTALGKLKKAELKNFLGIRSA